jgi:hypothetical protein
LHLGNVGKDVLFGDAAPDAGTVDLADVETVLFRNTADGR